MVSSRKDRRVSVFCSRCGQELAEGSAFCNKCGNPIVSRVVVNDGLCIFIPHNILALWSYYLGIFAFLCGITSIPAIITGFMGLNYAKKHPEAKGAIHCWVGITIGAVSLLLTVLFIIFIVLKI